MDNPEVLLGLITLYRAKGSSRKLGELGGGPVRATRGAARKGHTLKEDLWQPEAKRSGLCGTPKEVPDVGGGPSGPVEVGREDVPSAPSAHLRRYQT
jgi:hypothetical protein